MLWLWKAAGRRIGRGCELSWQEEESVQVQVQV